MRKGFVNEKSPFSSRSASDVNSALFELSRDGDRSVEKARRFNLLESVDDDNGGGGGGGVDDESADKTSGLMLTERGESPSFAERPPSSCTHASRD